MNVMRKVGLASGLPILIAAIFIATK